MKYTVSSSPHIYSGSDTSRIMWDVVIALLPACIFGTVQFGWRALVVLLVSIGSSLLCEWLLERKNNSRILMDGSAFVTGMLIGMNMSSDVPLLIPVIASFFAMTVVKWTFGGLGSNWMNPALGGRVFVFFSFTSLMSRYSMPLSLRSSCPEIISGATPLSFVKTTLAANGPQGLTTLEIMHDASFPISSVAEKISSLIGLDPYVIDAFIGNIPGCIGETSALLLLIGAIYLLIRKVITWHIPVSYLASFSLLSWMFGGIRMGSGMFSGEILYPLFTGGLMLGALFMATDMVTTPVTGKGQIVFGIGCGFFTFLFRYFGSLSESVSLAIILMNIITPTIDRYMRPRRFGYVKPKKEGSK